MKYVALDIETANNHAGSICAIGMARFVNDELVSEYYSLIRPPEAFAQMNPYCVAVHGITTAMLKNAPSFGDAFHGIGRFIDDNLLVAHNAPFDSRHLHEAISYCGMDKEYEFRCTLALARRTLNLRSYKLDAVCKHLGISLVGYHNALNDAVACGKVFAALRER